MTFEEFILLHAGDDTSKLLLSGKVPGGFDLEEAVSTIECRKALSKKVPEWMQLSTLRFPLRLGAEQCSSSATALEKASIARHFAGGGAVADLTGGLGVDAWAFSRHFDKVLYNEMSPVLCNAARHNFPLLGMSSVEIRNFCVGETPLREILGDFIPDLIFLDPARRSVGGRKVFRLQDCSPDVTLLVPELFEACPRLMLKLSPMADLTELTRQLPGLEEMYCIGSEGECKEILALLRKNFDGGPEIIVRDLPEGVFRFRPSEERSSCAVCMDRSMPLPRYLLEPSKALLKSGAFNLASARFKVLKAAPSTHLYFSDSPVEAFPGKIFEIIDVSPFSGKAIKDFAARYSVYGVTARNLPVSSDELSRKTGPGNPSGPPVHIFAFSLSDSSRIILAASSSN
ncbi:MAG: hypothetical protein IKR69_03825 [Bacteroidales bacterium]|nr:hypothetical protein [Bacteroidales bacterium]